LKKFISQVLLNSDNAEHTDLPKDISALVASDYSGVEVRREYKNIDLLIISPINRLVMSIENKIRAKESDTQLSRYEEIVKEEFGDVENTILQIFLTPNGELPKGSQSYLVATHQSILEILGNITDIYERRIPDRELQFVEDYKSILREELGMDEKYTKLCRKIYNEHREAIDELYAIGNRIDLEPAARRFNKEQGGRLQLTIVGANRAWFLPSEFSGLPRIGIEKWNGDTKSVIACFFQIYGKDKLKIVLEVGPFENSGNRVEFCLFLKSLGFKIPDKALQPEGCYTRLFTKHKPIKDWGDHDKVLEAMSKLYLDNEVQVVIKKLKEATDSFPWTNIT
jgi:hypothetical protein